MSYDHTITKGTTSKVIEVTIRDSTTGAGKTGIAHGSVTGSYVREGGTRTAITLTAGTAGDAYSSGKWAEVDATNCKGLYQLHVPDAALATGVNAVTIQLQATGVIDKALRIALIDANLRDAVRLGLTALPNSTNLAVSAGQIIQGTASGTPTTTTMQASDLPSTVDNHYNGRIIIFTSGTLAGQATDITDYVGSTKTLTFTALTSAPTTETFIIV